MDIDDVLRADAVAWQAEMGRVPVSASSRPPARRHWPQLLVAIGSAAAVVGLIVTTGALSHHGTARNDATSTAAASAQTSVTAPSKTATPSEPPATPTAATGPSSPPATPVGEPDTGAALPAMYKALPLRSAPPSITGGASDISMPWLLASRAGDTIQVVYVTGVGSCVVPIGYQVIQDSHRLELVMLSRNVAKDGTPCALNEPIYRTTLHIPGSSDLALLHAPVSAQWRGALPSPAA